MFIHLAAYRSNEQENRYVAAVMLVELEAHASNYKLNSGGDEDQDTYLQAPEGAERSEVSGSQ